MPKKFQGENSKAAEAKARKTAIKEEQDLKKKQQLEDEYWKDDDKHVMKKLQRKEEKDKKKSEQLEKKKELQKLADEEMASLAKISAKNQQPSKLTRTQVEMHKEAINASTKTKLQPKEEPLEENLNKIVIEGEVARTVEDAINLLNSTELEADAHPEKRMKAAYLAFEEKYLPILKAENPNLRLSQLKQLLRKDWNKSAENPLNQALKSTTSSAN
ncbi:hypothetical protein HELRODRAFT_66455 [Helobdella robusta]|uniref:Coiled-coil domain-containing protein n=1 Tax=Helobdella robusta TaxID=6412 RepID=T1FYL3_HELRO|nr:hypothetical protein HELRODRAFT_66455 [Helobdella robusta]ESN98742.1 hypothetical protein HELRODRAFT_66455 [Helobdella robusta]